MFYRTCIGLAYKTTYQLSVRTNGKIKNLDHTVISFKKNKRKNFCTTKLKATYKIREIICKSYINQ